MSSLREYVLKCNILILFHVRGIRKSRRLNFHSQDVEIEPAVLKEFTPLIIPHKKSAMGRPELNKGTTIYAKIKKKATRKERTNLFHPFKNYMNYLVEMLRSSEFRSSQAGSLIWSRPYISRLIMPRTFSNKPSTNIVRTRGKSENNVTFQILSLI